MSPVYTVVPLGRGDTIWLALRGGASLCVARRADSYTEGVGNNDMKLYIENRSTSSIGWPMWCN